MMQGKAILFSAALVALGAPITAQQSCFARQYTAEHMDKNQTQVITSIAIRFQGPATDKSNTGEWGDVTAYFKGEQTKFTQTLYCSLYEGSHYCGVECDGGRTEVKWKGPDTILLRTDGFVVSGRCDGTEQTLRYVKDKTDGFTTFRLNRASMDKCPPLD
jgi:hypothetical protein